MNDRYQRVSELFQVACELDEPDRSDYLDVRCGDDTGLRAEVEELLGFDVEPEQLGTEVPRHLPLAPGRLFAGRYRILEFRGRGGSSMVYRAIDERLGQAVALKVLRTSSPARLARLAHEVRLARRITHPAVCRVHDIGECDGEGYLTMEFVEGRTLGDVLRDRGPLPPEQVEGIARELLEGVMAAHAEGVVHGDLKPDNLLVDGDGRLRISDFGTAHGGEEPVGPPEGTPDYMAPELRRGESASARSDLHSLGVVLYELLTGALPATPPAPVSHLVSAVDPRLERAVFAALEPDPARRPASARVMLEGLTREAGRATGPESPGPLPGFEQRRVTAMFWQRSDEQEYAERHGLVLDEVFEMSAERRAAAEAIVSRHGGVVSQSMGSRTLVLFGLPPNAPDAPHRAAQAAIELVESCLEFNQDHALPPDDPPEIRIGLHMAVAIIETTQEGRVYTRGPLVNVAEALARRAEAQQVVASDAVQSQLADEATLAWTPRGKLLVYEGADPIPFSALRRAEPSRSRPQPIPHGPLLGRDAALRSLGERWQRVQAGQGQVVLIRGEPGIGKSRLVQELRRHIDEPGLHWTEVTCTPATANTPLYPLVSMLSRIGGLGSIPPAERRRRILDWLARNDLDRPEIVAGVERLLEFHAPDTDASSPPTAFGREFFQTLLPITQRITGRTRIVGVIEDLQWADPSTLATLRLAVMAMQTMPELLIFTLPHDMELDWPRPDWLLELTLDSLTEADVRQLVEHSARGPLEPAVVDEIAARAEGNPAFAVALAEAGPGPTGSLPASLQDSLLARLDALGGAKRVAQLASVLGRGFRRDALVGIAEELDVRAVDAALHQLEDAGILVCTDLPPRARYRFQQDLLREAAYASLPPAQRARLHQQASLVIEQMESAWVQKNPEIVAYHLERAGLAEESVLAWERTADRAAEAGAWTEATAHLTHALENTLQLTHARGRGELELQLLLKRGRAMLAGRYSVDEIGETFDRALALARTLPPGEDVFRSLLEVWLHRSRLCDGRASKLSEELEHLARAMCDRHLQSVSALVRAQTEALRGRPREVERHARRALELCDPSRRRSDVRQGRADVVSLAQIMLARSAWLLGEPDRAVERARLATTAMRVVDAPQNSTLIDSHLASLLCWLGHEGEARDAAERVLAQPDRSGISYFAAAALGARSELLLRKGESEAARDAARGAIALLEETGCPLGQGRAHTLLAEALAACGEREAAVAAAREGVKLASELADRQLLAEAHRVLGERLLETDPRAAEGRDQLFAALALARERETLSLELRAALSLERAGFDPETDLARLRAVRDRFREGFGTPDLREAARRLDPGAA